MVLQVLFGNSKTKREQIFTFPLEKESICLSILTLSGNISYFPFIGNPTVNM